MKKLLIILLAFVMIFMVACSNEKIDASTNEQKNVEEEKKEEQEEQAKETEELPIHPDEIKPTITILEPDSIGTVYMEATYTNNSKYPIIAYDMTVLLKDTNEKTYLTCYDTVLPGETSPKFESFGPSTRDPNDYEILKLEVTAIDEDGENLYIEYDFKLGEARWR